MTSPTLQPVSTLLTIILNSSTNSTDATPTPTGINFVVGLVVEVIILLLITGNLLMVVTLLLYKPWSTTDLLLCSLSLADLINGVIPMQVLNVVNSFIGQNQWTAELCAVFIWMTFNLRMASVLTITLISAERMLMLTRPLQHHTIVTTGKARLAILGIWLASVFISVLPFIGAGKSGFSKGFCFYQLYDLGIAYGVVVEAIGIIQLILVLACFVAIKLSSGKFIKRQSTMAAASMTGGNHQKGLETTGTKQVRQLSKMMAIVVVLYYLSWLPYLMSNLVSLTRGRLPHGVQIIVGLFSLVSALINPILYGKMSLRYRKGYVFICKKILSVCGGEKPDGAFFDGTRRGSMAALNTAYSLAAKRGSSASVQDLGGHHVNVAFENDDIREENEESQEQNGTKRKVKYSDDAVILGSGKDQEDSDDDENAISIYPVDSGNNNDDNTEETEDQEISIYPFDDQEVVHQIQTNGVKKQDVEKEIIRGKTEGDKKNEDQNKIEGNVIITSFKPKDEIMNVELRERGEDEAIGRDYEDQHKQGTNDGTLDISDELEYDEDDMKNVFLREENDDQLGSQKSVEDDERTSFTSVMLDDLFAGLEDYDSIEGQEQDAMKSIPSDSSEILGRDEVSGAMSKCDDTVDVLESYYNDEDRSRSTSTASNYDEECMGTSDKNLLDDLGKKKAMPMNI